MMEKNHQRVLLVEDNEKIQQGNRRMLEWEGNTVDAAATLAAAERCIAENRPDVIILDIMLPDGNGLDFLAQLRESVHGGIPILLLTGLAGHEDILQGLERGGDDYLTKHYGFEILLARISALLPRAHRLPELVTLVQLVVDFVAGTALASWTSVAGVRGAG